MNGHKSKALFSKIFYINLDRRPDRDENIKKQINEHGLDNITERISASDGSKLDLNDDYLSSFVTKKGIENAKNKKMRAYVPMTPGGIGCALSHNKIWEKIKRDKIDAALILEDDVRIDKNFKSLIKKYSNNLPSSYDVLFLGYHPSSIKYVDTKSPDVFVKSKRVYGLFGYIVTLPGAFKLTSLFPIEDQIDTEIYRGFTTHGINAYLIRPELRFITSDPSEVAKEFGTDIQTRQKIETFDNSDLIMSDFIDVVLVISLVALLLLFIDTVIFL